MSWRWCGWNLLGQPGREVLHTLGEFLTTERSLGEEVDRWHHLTAWHLASTWDQGISICHKASHSWQIMKMIAFTARLMYISTYSSGFWHDGWPWEVERPEVKVQRSRVKGQVKGPMHQGLLLTSFRTHHASPCNLTGDFSLKSYTCLSLSSLKSCPPNVMSD